MSYRTAVPVRAEPHPDWVRSWIRHLVRKYGSYVSPIQVEPLGDAAYRITYYLPDGDHRMVVFDDEEVPD